MVIIPEKDLADILLRVESPGRYTGGEYGVVKKTDPLLRIALCFPDLYELGMSNQAMAILYGMLNSLEGISCERVFCPAQDFNQELQKKSLPLYGLDCGTPLNEFDLIAFTIGYELSATNVLAVLDSGKIPLLAGQRGEGDPIVIAGGPAITNPVPFGDFFEAVYIGEGEADFLRLVIQARELIKKGGNREDVLDCIINYTSFWYKGKEGPTLRAVWNRFSVEYLKNAGFPVPNIRTVQDHGVVEIMRGCPHGCRFCHAGIYYRPFRMKNFENIYEEVEKLVHKCGYREITLSSLSSGDYRGISDLVGFLNKNYKKDFVSFALPSLHIDSFALQVLGNLSEVRKSGLTFAVETPRDEYQRGLNKSIAREKIESILKEAKNLGWKGAKFYFMIGLPFHYDNEAGEISEYIEDIYRKTTIPMNINVGTFIPKPHTPYQWEGQLNENEALERIHAIKRNLRKIPVKIGYHSPFQSFLEGVISRGDARAGKLILKAYKQGACFDAWEDKIQKNIWRRVIEEAEWDVEAETCAPRDMEKSLPWNTIKIGVNENYYKNEKHKSEISVLTESCTENCLKCGVCNSEISPYRETGFAREYSEEKNLKDLGDLPMKGRTVYRYIISYRKKGKAVYIPHLGLMRVMERSLLRSGVSVRFTEGFNPKPVLEFAQPLSLGIPSENEIFSFDSWEQMDGMSIVSRCNSHVPEGLRLFDCKIISFKEGEKKPVSLMSNFIGSRYAMTFIDKATKNFAMEHLGRNSSIFTVTDLDLKVQVDHYPENSKGFLTLMKELFNGPYYDFVRIGKIQTFLKE